MQKCGAKRIPLCRKKKEGGSGREGNITQSVNRCAEIRRKPTLISARWSLMSIEFPAMPNANFCTIFKNRTKFLKCHSTDENHKNRNPRAEMRRIMHTVATNMARTKVGGLMCSPSGPYATWHVYHMTARPGRQTVENSIDSRDPSQGGACIRHAT